MAMVPRATNQNIGGGAQSYVSSNAPANAFGATTAEGLKDLGRGFSQLGEGFEQLRQQNIQREAKNLYNQYSAEKRRILYGDGTPKNQGFYGNKGENALAAAPSLEKQLQELRSSMLKNVSSSGAREAFTNAAAASDEADMDGVRRYTIGQRDVAMDATDNATIEEAMSRAASGWADNAVVDQASFTIGSTVADMASRKGLSTEAMQQAVRSAHSSMFDKVIQAAAQTDTKRARELYDKVESGIDGVTKTSILAKLEAKEKQDLSDRYAAETHQYQLTQRFQGENFDKLAAGVAANTTTQDQIVAAMGAGRISGQHGQNLLSFIQTNKERLEKGGDLGEYNSVRLKILMGDATIQEAMTNPLIDKQMVSSLMNDWSSVQAQGPVFLRKDIKDAQEEVKSSAGGQKDMFGEFTAVEDRARAALAIEQFNAQVRGLTDAERTPQRIMEIRDAMIQAYKAKALSVDFSINRRPLTPYLNRSVGKQDRLTWQTNMEAAKLRLNMDKDDGTISEDEWKRQAIILRGYQEDIDRME